MNIIQYFDGHTSCVTRLKYKDKYLMGGNVYKSWRPQLTDMPDGKARLAFILTDYEGCEHEIPPGTELEVVDHDHEELWVNPDGDVLGELAEARKKWFEENVHYLKELMDKAPRTDNPYLKKKEENNDQ